MYLEAKKPLGFFHLDVTPSPSNRHNIWSSKFLEGTSLYIHPQFPLVMEQRQLLKHIQNLAKTCVPSHLSIDSALMRRLSPTCQGHIGSPKCCWLIWYTTHASVFTRDLYTLTTQNSNKAASTTKSDIFSTPRRTLDGHHQSWKASQLVRFLVGPKKKNKRWALTIVINIVIGPL